MQNVKLKVLVSFKVSLLMIWGIGILFLHKLQQIMKQMKQILKLVQLNHQMDFCIWGRPHWMRDETLDTLGYFLLILAAGLADLGSRIPESFKYPKYWKVDITLP